MVTLIKDDYSDKTVRRIHWGEEQSIRDLLLGHKVEKVTDDHLLLDDGTLLRVLPNEGGCACSAGDYVLDDLNEVDNIITAVEFDVEVIDDTWDEEKIYRLFVVAEDKKLKLFSVSGDDGNGYYGTGYEILVRKQK